MLSAALLIFAVCACYALLRGAGRMIANTFILGASAWAAHAAWRIAPEYSLSPLVTTGVPIALFFLTLIVLRRLLRFLFPPSPPSAATPFFSPATVGKLLLSLFPALLLCLIAAAVILHRGSIAELRHPETPTLLSRWKQSVSHLLPASFAAFLDPSTSPDRVSLVRLISSRAQSPPPPEIDPETGEPIPRAIIVDDPALQDLARNGDFSTLLRHPLLDKFLQDPRARAMLGRNEK